MQTSTFKSKVDLLPVLAVLFLTSNSSASTSKQRERVVRFDPSISMPQRSEMRAVDCSNTPTILKLQAEFQTLAVLFQFNTELGIMRMKAMKIVMPGYPLYISNAKCLSAVISIEAVENESIRKWKGYSLKECSVKLGEAYEYFSNIADYSDLDELTRNYYNALAQATFYFANAFDWLQDGSLSTDGISRQLDECFRDDPQANRVRGIFFAVSRKLHDELSAAAH